MLRTSAMYAVRLKGGRTTPFLSIDVFPCFPVFKRFETIYITTFVGNVWKYSTRTYSIYVHGVYYSTRFVRIFLFCISSVIHVSDPQCNAWNSPGGYETNIWHYRLKD